MRLKPPALPDELVVTVGGLAIAITIAGVFSEADPQTRGWLPVLALVLGVALLTLSAFWAWGLRLGKLHPPPVAPADPARTPAP